MADASFGRTVGKHGLIAVKSNADLQAESDAAYERHKALDNPPRHITELAGYIRKCWESAESHKSSFISDRLMDCQRRRKGVYAPDRLAEIQKRGGSTLFFNITDTKEGAFEAWISEILTPNKGNIWKFEPTPIPDLPDDIKSQIVATTVERFNLARGMGDVVRAEDVREFALGLFDQQLKAVKKEAEERAGRMAEKVGDQLTEGGWECALDTFIRDLATYPSAILKGPVIKRVKRLKWENDVPTPTFEEVPTWCAVNPHDFYPAPNIKSVQDGYICEIVRIEKAELAKLREVEGYSAEAINAVLKDAGEGGVKTVTDTTEPERADLEGRDTSENEGLPEGAVQGVEFWGNVQGKLLADWGLEVEDENDYYHICALLVGEHVIRAILNPDPIGQNPYFVTSYELMSGEVWGRAIAEKMTDCQDAVNGCLRNAQSNLGLASGPMVQVDIDALDPAIDPTDIYPWKVWQYHGSKAPYSRAPVDFFQPQSMARELQEISEYYEVKADDRTLIPRYAHGNEQMQGAGATASGMSMLMTAAAKGVRRVVGNVDRDIIRPALEHLYRWNLVYLDDADWKAAKGDIRILPQGQIAALVREQTQELRQQFLASSMNLIDQQIVGIRERAAVWRAIAAELGLPVDDVVKPDSEILKQMGPQQPTPEDMEIAQGEQMQMGQPGNQGAGAGMGGGGARVNMPPAAPTAGANVR